jgi:hypothetical protein
MSSDGDEIGRIASAEKQLCDQAGPLLAEIIRGVEERYGISIAELRVTMEPSEPGNGWSGARLLRLCCVRRSGHAAPGM